MCSFSLPFKPIRGGDFSLLFTLLMKIKNYSFNVEKFVKNEALFIQSLNEYLR